MLAHYDRHFRKGFLLSEESVAKIFDILKKRLAEFGLNGSPVCKIIREDGLLYTTSNIADLCAEENSTRNKIRIVMFEYVSELMKIGLRFDNQIDTDLKIEAADKNHALLLFSDLKEYLQTEVLVFRSFFFNKSKFEALIGALLPTVAMLSVFFLTPTRFPQEKDVADALNQVEVTAKLDFLIRAAQSRNESQSFRYLIIGMIVISIIAILIAPPS